MTLPETWEHFKLTYDFQPTDAIGVIFAAGIFDAVKKYETKRGGIKKLEEIEKLVEIGLTVKDGINPLPEVYKDAFKLTEAL